MIDPKRLMELSYDKPPITPEELDLVEIAKLVNPTVWRLKHRWRRYETLKAAVRLQGRHQPVFNFEVRIPARKPTFLSRFRRAA